METTWSDYNLLKLKFKHLDGYCKTIEGNDPGKPCVFPFIHKGTTYTTCTKSGKNSCKPWCSTKVDESGTHMEDNWGVCNRGCPGGESGTDRLANLHEYFIN